MTNSVIIIAVGLPAVGKSTWFNQYKQPETIIVSSDDLIEAEAARLGKTYNEVFPDYIKTSDALFWQALAEGLYDGKNIIVDRTNLSVKSRKRILDMVPGEYKKHACVFTVDLLTWIERLKSRPGKTIPGNVVGMMISSFEMPTLDEGFDEVYSSKVYL